MTPISYDLKGAQAVTGLSTSHLKRAIGEGHLKAKRSNERDDGTLAGKWVIRARDLEAYIDSLPDG